MQASSVTQDGQSCQKSLMRIQPQTLKPIASVPYGAVLACIVGRQEGLLSTKGGGLGGGGGGLGGGPAQTQSNVESPRQACKLQATQDGHSCQRQTVQTQLQTVKVTATHIIVLACIAREGLLSVKGGGLGGGGGGLGGGPAQTQSHVDHSLTGQMQHGASDSRRWHSVKASMSR